jgi:lysozyme
MQPSDLVTKFLARDDMEGCRLNVYLDPAGLPTIGIGHLLTRSELSSGKISIAGLVVRYGNGITQIQADTLCLQDAQKAADVVNDNVAVNLIQCQFDALVLFTFNIGASAFKNSTLLKMLNQGRYDQVPGQMERWIYAGGRVLRGLIHRRDEEIKVWKKGIYGSC